MSARIIARGPVAGNKSAVRGYVTMNDAALRRGLLMPDGRPAQLLWPMAFTSFW